MDNESPIPGLKVAGPHDLKELLAMQVAMDVRWLAWLNERVLNAIKQGWKGRLTHLRFVPDVENGLLYMLPTLSGQYGAIRLNYSGPETGALLSLYIPLLRFGLEREVGRQRLFEVVEGEKYLALNVRDSRSVPSRSRGSRALWAERLPTRRQRPGMARRAGRSSAAGPEPSRLTLGRWQFAGDARCCPVGQSWAAAVIVGDSAGKMLELPRGTARTFRRTTRE